jgi:molecular chaperone GrpE
MSYLYNNPYNRRRPTVPPGGGGGLPTLEDFQKLARAYEELKQRADEQARQLKDKTTELGVKDEALHRQSEDLKKLETEQLFLRAALAEAEQKLANPEEASWQERFLRLQAEVDNLRKRWEQRAAAEGAEFRQKILVDMIPLADHLDLALQHAPATDEVGVKNFVGNIEATRRAFLETLRRYGVERIDPVGEPFDPNQHEAIGHVQGGDIPADHVAQVVQAGYREGERLVRPARVLVSG